MEKNWLDRHWVMLLVLGIVAIVFAIMAIVWPGITATAFTVLWGCWALLAGLVSLVGAFGKDATGRGWLILFGAVSILAGLLAVVHPLEIAVTLTWILGIWFIVGAIFQAVGAFSSTRTRPRWMLLVAAALSLLIGILFVARPGVGVVSIVVWVAILGIIWGIVLIIAAFAARSLGKEIDAAAAQPAGPAP